MTLENFYTEIKKAIGSFENTSGAKTFMEIIEAAKQGKDVLNKMTVLFEAYYQFLPDDSSEKKIFLAIRLQRWKAHFGVPTVTFLVTYWQDIQNLQRSFSDLSEFSNTPNNAYTDIDTTNQVLINSNALATIPMPPEEKPLVWLKTHNPHGGFTLPASDPYSQAFIQDAADAGKKNERVLEIGAAFGTATLEALEKGANVDCNDIYPHNLGVVQNRFSAKTNIQPDPMTGDNEKLRLLPGKFPNELTGLPSGKYKAILACRVLHFLQGPQIDEAIKSMADLLQPGGKLYVVCETPYQKNWQSFLPTFEKNVAEGKEWPGEITDSSKYEISGRGTLPKFMHSLTTDVLERSAKRTGTLNVVKCSYISRKGLFTEDVLLDGKESVGLIAEKQIRAKI